MKTFLEEKIMPEPTTGCWLWTGEVNPFGYGVIASRFRSEDRSKMAHRYVYQEQVGEIPETHVLVHSCKNKQCVNPQHLELVSHEEKYRRSRPASRRNPKKPACPNGHPYTTDNIFLARRGDYTYRRCRKCMQLNTQKQQSKKKLKQAAL